MCQRSYDPARYRNGTLVACGCGNLLIMLRPEAKDTNPGRRSSDVKSKLLQRKLEVLAEASSLISTIREIDRLILFSIRLGDELLDAGRTVIALQEKPWNTLLLHSVTGRTMQLRRIHVGQGLIGTCVGEKKLIQVASVRHDGRYLPEIDGAMEGKATSVLCVPLFAAGECIGALQCMLKKNSGSFTEEDVLFARLAAGHIAAAIQYVRRSTEAAMLGERITGLNSGFNALMQQMRLVVGKLSMALVQVNFKLGDRGSRASKEFDLLEGCIRQLDDIVKAEPPQGQGRQVG
jgi:putative methionine-R-sulfoxide reductase with GAF domain